jgi:hypothetical protein
VAEAWLRAKGNVKDHLLTQAVAEIMAERNVDENTAITEVIEKGHLTGFKSDPERGLYIEGRQLKACIKEAASVATAVEKLPDRWGKTRKGTLGFVSEHIFVVEDRLYLGLDEPSEVRQSFVHTFRGSGIQYTELAEDVEIGFTIESDYDFKESEWGALWLTAERQGVGAARSQGFGRFVTVEWEPLKAARTTPIKTTPTKTTRKAA